MSKFILGDIVSWKNDRYNLPWAIGLIYSNECGDWFILRGPYSSLVHVKEEEVELIEQADIVD